MFWVGAPRCRMSAHRLVLVVEGKRFDSFSEILRAYQYAQPLRRNGEVMAGKHRAEKTQRLQTEAYVWLGTGAITLALGVALTGGSGVAQADTTSSAGSGPRVSPAPGNSAATTSIRTTISAQSVNTSTHSSTPKLAGEESATSIVSTRESVVRNQDPAVTGDNNPGPGPTLAETVIGLNQGDPEVISGLPGLEAVKDIPFIELGGGGGGLLSTIAGALSNGMF
jgi:hypothetical protein